MQPIICTSTPISRYQELYTGVDFNQFSHPPHTAEVLAQSRSHNTQPWAKAFGSHKRNLARSILKRKYTAITWQSTQPHPEWQY